MVSLCLWSRDTSFWAGGARVALQAAHKNSIGTAIPISRVPLSTWSHPPLNSLRFDHITTWVIRACAILEQPFASRLSNHHLAYCSSFVAELIVFLRTYPCYVYPNRDSIVWRYSDDTMPKIPQTGGYHCGAARSRIHHGTLIEEYGLYIPVKMCTSSICGFNGYSMIYLSVIRLNGSMVPSCSNHAE